MARIAEVGTQATCRNCKTPIKLFRKPDSGYWVTPTWVHLNHESYCPGQDHVENAWNRSNAEPMEWCLFVKNDGDPCNRPIKHEDMVAKNYVCGTHMRKWLEQQDARRRSREAAIKRAEEAELEKFELESYKKCEAELRRILGDDFFGDRHCFRSYYSGGERLNRTVEIDWWELYNAVKVLKVDA